MVALNIKSKSVKVGLGFLLKIWQICNGTKRVCGRNAPIYINIRKQTPYHVMYNSMYTVSVLSYISVLSLHSPTSSTLQSE